jgi:transcription elongation factor Elf1
VSARAFQKIEVMGKRKSARLPQCKQAVEKLDKEFTCPFCNYDLKSVTCFLDRKKLIGTAKCSICSEEFRTQINILSAAIDVYSDWIDACEQVNGGPQTIEDLPRRVKTKKIRNKAKV